MKYIIRIYEKEAIPGEELAERSDLNLTDILPHVEELFEEFYVNEGIFDSFVIKIDEEEDTE